MNPDCFIAKWKAADLSERAAAQSGPGYLRDLSPRLIVIETGHEPRSE